MLLVLLWASAIGAGAADGITGNDIQAWRQRDKTVFGAYVMGAIDGVLFQNAILKTSEPLPFCMPERANYAQAVDIVGKYLDDMPAQRHHPASTIVAIALQRVWPCAK